MTNQQLRNEIKIIEEELSYFRTELKKYDRLINNEGDWIKKEFYVNCYHEIKNDIEELEERKQKINFKGL